MKSKALVATLLVSALASSVALAETPLQRMSNDTSSRQQDIISELRKAGYSDVRTLSGSTIVQAKDRNGGAVTMILGMQETPTVGANTSSGASAMPPANAPGGAFTAVPAKDSLGSKVMGLEVYNNAKQNVGTIKDVAFNENGIDGYILSVGGFLGLGEHYVAVRPAAVKITYDKGDNRWHAAMDTTAEQLKAAPEFKYPSNT